MKTYEIKTVELTYDDIIEIHVQLDLIKSKLFSINRASGVFSPKAFDGEKELFDLSKLLEKILNNCK